MSNPWREYHAVCCNRTLQYTLWMREVEWQWDILQRFNNLFLLYESVIRDKISFPTLIGLQVPVIRDKLSFPTLNGLQVQRAIKEQFYSNHGQFEQEMREVKNTIARMEVSPPTHNSTLHHCTFIHHGTDVLSCQPAVPYSHHYTVCHALW